MLPSAVLGLAGAPTVVVEASLRACRDVLAPSYDVLGVTGGPDGLVAGAFTPVTASTLSAEPAAGCRLGGGRRVMKPDDIVSIVDRLEASHVTALVMAGGNGTMALLAAVDAEARGRDIGLQTVGIPKTIDNDLRGVEFSPGFGSVARFLALTIPDIARDHLAMSTMEPIRIVETMGRGTGWLAASGAAGLSLEDPSLGADLTLIPEFSTLTLPQIFEAVERTLSSKSRAFIVCSEGFSFPGSRDDYQAVNHSTLLHGGVARRLARALEAELGRPARGEVIGTQQRSAHAFASAADLRCARQVGEGAARFIREGRRGVMAGTRRTDRASLTLAVEPTSLAKVASRTRPLPEAFWPGEARRESAFRDWLRPIIGADQV